jgi:hypothetical protein
MNGVITHNGGGVCYYCYPNPSGTSDGGANGLTDNPVRSTQVPIIDYPGAPLGPEILTTPIFQLGTEILATPIFGVGPEILTTPIFEGGPEFLKTPLFERGAEFLKTPSWIIGRQVDAALPPRIRKLATAHITGSGDTVLGHMRPPPSYIDKAQARGASYFDIGSVWNTLTPDERWEANAYFLDQISASGDRVLLSVPKTKIRSGSDLEKEVAYLIKEKDYMLVNQFKPRS